MGSWRLSSGCGSKGDEAIGEILGVYGEALTVGDLTDGPILVCPCRAARGVRRRADYRPEREAVQVTLQGLI